MGESVQREKTLETEPLGAPIFKRKRGERETTEAELESYGKILELCPGSEGKVSRRE